MKILASRTCWSDEITYVVTTNDSTLKLHCFYTILELIEQNKTNKMVVVLVLAREIRTVASKIDRHVD